MFSRKCVGCSFATAIFNDLWDANMTKEVLLRGAGGWVQTGEEDDGRFLARTVVVVEMGHHLPHSALQLHRQRMLTGPQA